eukprot:CAMPEP_0118635046 /NCGR_PEP_ID=MMETSP0785-20121206/1869_1 /TAXON_ID=91992 /ORGANISM="Bolidomonas pacifica, Strain CCMP 1866" /LENGTH=243 /DNA_ID=CAMNT_0006526057 /DNA_START=133 /DNA_END=862 /DNA_ORIENTATION=+
MTSVCFSHLKFTSLTVICLTDGGYRGANDAIIRRSEMETSCKDVFGVKDVVIAQIQGVVDTPVEGKWEGMELEIENLIEATLKGLLEKSKAISNVNILTFDDGGVSGHCNHCDCSKIVTSWFDDLPSPCKLPASTSLANVRLFQLRTIEPYLFPEVYAALLGSRRVGRIRYHEQGGHGNGSEGDGNAQVPVRLVPPSVCVFFLLRLVNVLVERRQRGQNYHNNRGKSVGALAVLGAMVALNIA